MLRSSFVAVSVGASSSEHGAAAAGRSPCRARRSRRRRRRQPRSDRGVPESLSRSHSAAQRPQRCTEATGNEAPVVAVGGPWGRAVRREWRKELRFREGTEAMSTCEATYRKSLTSELKRINPTRSVSFWLVTRWLPKFTAQQKRPTNQTCCVHPHSRTHQDSSAAVSGKAQGRPDSGLLVLKGSFWAGRKTTLYTGR